MEVIGVERPASSAGVGAPFDRPLQRPCPRRFALHAMRRVCGCLRCRRRIDTPRIDVFQALVNGGFDTNTRLRHTNNMFFLNFGHVDILTWVLAWWANPNHSRSGMLSALDLAVIKSSAEAVQFLIQHGANVRDTNALKTAAYQNTLKIIPLLLEAGAEVNETSDYEEMLDREREQGLKTVLHQTALGGQLEAVKLLFEKGANPALKNILGNTARDLAREKEHVGVVEVLERKSRV